MAGRRIIGSLIFVIAVAGVGVAVARVLQRLQTHETEVPTARITRGSLALNVHTTGELRPVRSAMLVAPQVGGGLQIVHLQKTGTRVQAGDAVIEFDPSEQQYSLEQSRSEWLQAEQEIVKMKADGAVQAAQDRVALLKARFDVRRAELEVSRNELVSSIDGRKNLLNLEEARRRLEQLEQDIQSREASSQADLAVSREKSNKARLAMQQAQQNIENMRLRAPIAGIVAVKENQDASGGFFFTGMSLPEYREGDQVGSGRLIAQVLDVENMEILSKVSENDRSNIRNGQVVEVKVDALPGRSFAGKVKTLAGLSTRRFFDSEGRRMFDASFQLDSLDENVRPGVTAQISILGDQIKDALLLPRQAVFERDGKPVVYVRNGKSLEPREIKIRFVTEGQVALEGVGEGTEVALVSPEQRAKKARPAAPISPVAGGGGH